MVALTGFDPTRDVGELLVASNGTPNTGLAMAARQLRRRQDRGGGHWPWRQ